MEREADKVSSLYLESMILDTSAIQDRKSLMSFIRDGKRTSHARQAFLRYYAHLI